MKNKKKLVVLTGSGISEESGISTFRGNRGLWEGHDIMEVATYSAWENNRELVLDFYNKRRKAAIAAQPNEAHKMLVELEDYFDVTVITQNVDNLHEKAGSSHVIHLHGELFKSRSTSDENLIYDVEGWELKIGDTCEKGSQLRPHIVWFGEAVPMIEEAIEYVEFADFFLVVGTSLLVYPAADLINYTRNAIPKIIVDVQIPELVKNSNIIEFEMKASEGMEKVKEYLIRKT